MALFIAKRLLMMIATMFVTSVLVFSMLEFSPGNVASKTLGPYATAAQKEILFKKLQLDDPLVVRYVRWISVLSGISKDPVYDPDLKLGYKDKRGDQYIGNFGWSLKYRLPVNDVMWRRLGNTMVLGGVAVWHHRAAFPCVRRSLGHAGGKSARQDHSPTRASRSPRSRNSPRPRSFS